MNVVVSDAKKGSRRLGGTMQRRSTLEGPERVGHFPAAQAVIDTNGKGFQQLSLHAQVPTK